ncbi:MAG: Ig-like domain-containing protein [Planctomycetota bacterium]
MDRLPMAGARARARRIASRGFWLCCLASLCACETRSGASGLPAAVQSAPAQVVYRYPEPDARGIRSDAIVTVQFDRELLAKSVDDDSVLLLAHDSIVPAAVALHRETIRLAPKSPLEAGVRYAVLLTPEIRDLSGRSIAGEVRWTFRAGSLTPFVVEGTEPENGAEITNLEPVIQIYFSEELDPTSVGSASVQLLSGSSDTPGRIEVLEDVILFEPVQTLAEGRQYRIRVAAGIESLSGEALAEPYTSAFSTSSGSPPEVTWVVPAPSQKDVPSDQEIEVHFTKPIAGDSVKEGNVSIVDDLGHLLAYESAVSDSVIHLRTRDLLPKRSRVSVTIQDVEDLQGRRMVTPYTWSFTVADWVLDPPVRLDVGQDRTTARLQHLTADREGNLFASWERLYIDADRLGIEGARYSKDEKTWQPPEPIAEFAIGRSSYTSQVSVAHGKGQSTVLWTLDGEIRARRYDSDNGHWGQSRVLFALPGMANSIRVAEDPSGDLIAAWIHRADGDGLNRPHLAWWSRTTDSWSPAKGVPGGEAHNASNLRLAAGYDRRAIIAWDHNDFVERWFYARQLFGPDSEGNLHRIQQLEGLQDSRISFGPTGLGFLVIRSATGFESADAFVTTYDGHVDTMIDGPRRFAEGVAGRNVLPPDIASDDLGNAVLVYQDLHSASVHAFRFDGIGRRWQSTSEPISTPGSLAVEPTITAGNKRFFALWKSTQGLLHIREYHPVEGWGTELSLGISEHAAFERHQVVYGGGSVFVIAETNDPNRQLTIWCQRLH